MSPIGQPRSTGTEAISQYDEFLADCDDRLLAGLESDDEAALADLPLSPTVPPGQRESGEPSTHPLSPDQQSAFAEAIDGLILLREVLGNAPSSTADSRAGRETIGPKPELPATAPNVFRGFEYLRTLGAGSGGWVFLARDLSLPRRVAIKTPRSDRQLSAAVPGAWIRPGTREAEAVARLDHPGIVPIHLFDHEADPPRIVMGYCDGGSLAQWLKSHPGPHCPRLSAQLVLDLCDAVGHAHSRDVIHRDLKPGNILLASRQGTRDADAGNTPPEALLQRWRLKVADFGLAQHAHDITTRDIVGTLPYMAPEQLDPDLGRADARSDIWSLGVILFELLTGTRPYPGDTIRDVLANIRKVGAASPRAFNRERRASSVPSRLSAIVTRCLAPETAARYQSIGELQDDLRRFLENLPTSQSSWLERVGHQLVQPRSLLTGIGLIGAGLLWWSLRSPAPAFQPLVGAHGSGQSANAAGDSTDPVQETALPQLDVEREILEQFGQPVIHRTFPNFEPSHLGRVQLADNVSLPDLPVGTEVGVIQLNSLGYCLAEFSPDPGEDFEFSVAIHQDNWEGACGLYLGYHMADNVYGQRVPRAQVFRLRIEGRGSLLTPLLQRLPADFQYDTDDLLIEKGLVPIDEVWIPKLETTGSPQRLKVVVKQGRVTEVWWNDEQYTDLATPEIDEWFETNKFPVAGALGVFSQGNTTFYQPRFRKLAHD